MRSAATFGAPFDAVTSTGETISWGFPQRGQLAMDAQGNAILGFMRSDGTDTRGEAAGFDAAGPLLGSVVFPAAGARGASLPFTGTAADVWSPVASTTWSFGDGTSAPGTAVSHAYGAAGDYRVGFTATDAVGNASTAGGRVVVSGDLLDPDAPGVSVRIAPGQSLGRVLRRGLRVRVVTDEAGRALVDALLDRRLLRRPSGSALARVGRRGRSFRAAGAATVTVKLSRKARRALTGRRRVGLVVRVGVTDPAGNVGRATRRVTLRR